MFESQQLQRLLAQGLLELASLTVLVETTPSHFKPKLDPTAPLTEAAMTNQKPSSDQQPPSNRRNFMTKIIAASVATGAVAQGSKAHAATNAQPARAANGARPKVIFLDVNETLLDLAPLKKTVGDALGGKSELLPLWFKTMLHYSLVATVADRYEHFTTIGAAALQMVAKNNDIEISTADADKAIEPIRSLSPHPDVEPALKKLADSGIKLVTLTNSSSKGVEQQMKNSGLQQYLTDRFSIEELGIYKPDSHVYRWAARKMDEDIGDCMLVAAHGWDIAGALWAGMRGAFLSRPGAQLYRLAPEPEISEPTLEEAAAKILALTGK